MSNRAIDISVAIPSYNRARLLPKAIESVLCQTFQAFELSVVDDGSSDNTQEVVGGYDDDRIRYIPHDRNRGLNPARNTGIRNARGAFVAFLDSDDEWLPDKLAAQRRLFDHSSFTRLGVVYAGLELYFPSGEHREIVPRKRGDVLNDQLTANLVQGGSNALVRKEVYEQEGLFDEADALWGGWDDIEMWIRVAHRWQFDFVPKPLFKMYKHEESRSLVISKENPDRLIEALHYVLEKHQSSFDRHPPAKAKMWRNMGTHHVAAGQMSAARRCFIEAIRATPRAPRSYMNLLVSLLGSKAYTTISRRKRGF